LSVKNGDFILIDSVAKVKETGEVFDTTIEEVAKKEGILKENEVYAPMLVVVGEGWVLKSLDESLPGLEVEKLATITIPPEKGFGPRDPKKVRSMPLRRFRKQNVSPTPGMRVDIDGKAAVIRTVGAGRVQVDFNAPLAGRTLTYDLTVKKVIDAVPDKIAALVRRRIQSAKAENLDLKITKTRVHIGLPKEVYYLEGLQFAKRGIANDIQKFFPSLRTVSFVETFTKASSQAGDVKPSEQASAQAGT